MLHDTSDDLRLRAAARRAFLTSAAVGTTAILVGCGRSSAPSSAETTAPAGEAEELENPAEEISPTEDLMREHGVLNRILLIYEQGIRLLESAPADFRPATFAAAAVIVRTFIEDYHEKLEEDHLFPRFEQAGRLTELVATLRLQHQAGRRLTEDVRRLTGAGTLAAAPDRDALATAMRQFIRMYRPHEAREDTVLFPALRSIVTPNEFDSLGEQFEDEEHRLFGKEGFEGIVEQVSALESRLGIHDLALFTPTFSD